MEDPPSKKSFLPSWLRHLGLSRKSRSQDGANITLTKASKFRGSARPSEDVGVCAQFTSVVGKEPVLSFPTTSLHCEAGSNQTQKRALPGSSQVKGPRKVQFGPEVQVEPRSSCHDKENVCGPTRSILRKGWVSNNDQRLSLGGANVPRQCRTNSRLSLGALPRTSNAHFEMDRREPLGALPRTSTAHPGMDRKEPLTAFGVFPTVQAKGSLGALSATSNVFSRMDRKEPPSSLGALPRTSTVLPGVDRREPLSSLKESPIAAECTVHSFAPQRSSNFVKDHRPLSSLPTTHMRGNRADQGGGNESCRVRVDGTQKAGQPSGFDQRVWYFGPDVRRVAAPESQSSNRCTHHHGTKAPSCSTRPHGGTLPKSWKHKPALNDDDRQSTLADDECSMNCSCSACTARAAKKHAENEPDVKVAVRKSLRRRRSRSREHQSQVPCTSHVDTALRHSTTPWYKCNPPGEEAHVYSNENISIIVEKAVRQSIEHFLSLNAIPLLDTPKTDNEHQKVPLYANIQAAPSDDKTVPAVSEAQEFSAVETFQKLLEECEPSGPATTDTIPKSIVGESETSQGVAGCEVKESEDDSGIHSRSLPDLNRLLECRVDKESRQDDQKSDSVNKSSVDLSKRRSPDGWERTPTSDDGQGPTDVSSEERSTENGTDILEDMQRQGMGLPPVTRVRRQGCPRSPAKYRAKDILTGKAKLKLAIYSNFGIVTVHVIRAAKLLSARCHRVNSYVKVSLQPDDTKRANWRTCIVKTNNDPIFDQKLSFEIGSEDCNKRLIISVWHRDVVNRRSEFLGCMSFGISHVQDPSQRIVGWYRLLTEAMGIQKHFAARTMKGKDTSLLNDSSLMVSRPCVV